MADPARTFAPWDAGHARGIVERLKSLPGAALPVLHALQEYFGYIHDDAIPLVAEALNLSKAEIVGVVHFYDDFRTSAPPTHVLQVCRAEACQAMGCDPLLAHVEELLGITVGETTADSSVELRTVYCLGNCAMSPAVMFDHRLYGRVTTARIDRILSGSPS